MNRNSYMAMNTGYIMLGVLILALLSVIAYLVWSQPKAQPVVIVEKELPRWMPWSYGWAQNPGTFFISRPFPQFYPTPHHAGSHPAISTGPHRPPLPMPQTPVPPHPPSPPQQPQPTTK